MDSNDAVFTIFYLAAISLAALWQNITQHIINDFYIVFDQQMDFWACRSMCCILKVTWWNFYVTFTFT